MFCRELIACMVLYSTVWRHHFFKMFLKQLLLFSKRSIIDRISLAFSPISPIRNTKKLNIVPRKFVVSDRMNFISPLHILPSIGFEDKQREQHDNEYIEEMGEDEYDALPEEEKHRIDQKRLQKKKDRILKYEITDCLHRHILVLESNEIRKKKHD